MVPADVILLHFTLIPLVLFRQEVHGEGLLEQRVAFVFLVRQNAQDGALPPVCLPAGCQYAHLIQHATDADGCHAFHELPVDETHDAGFLLIDHQVPVFSLVVTQEDAVGHRHLSVRHPLSVAPGDVFRDGTRFLLSQAAHDGDQQLALAVEGVDVLLLEKALAAVLLQLAVGRQAVHRVAGKPTDGLGDDQIDLSGQCVRDHLIEAVPVPGGHGADTLIGVDLYEVPVGM